MTIQDAIKFFEDGKGTGYKDIDEMCLEALKEKEQTNKNPALKEFISIYERTYKISVGNKEIKMFNAELGNKGELIDAIFEIENKRFKVYISFDGETFEPVYRMVQLRSEQ